MTFGPKETYDWFSTNGLNLKIEKNNKIFPDSNKAISVISFFKDLLSKYNITFCFSTCVTNIKKIDESFQIECLKNNENTNQNIFFSAKKILIATGGQFSKDLSNNLVYKSAISLGHTIKPLARSLGSFFVLEYWAKSLSGVSIKNALITLKTEKKYNFVGDFMFTHKGLTGPAIFSLSALSAYEKIASTLPAKLSIDFVPNLSYELLQNDLTSFVENNKNDFFKNFALKYIPKSLMNELFKQINIDVTLKNSNISKKAISKTIEFLKNTQLTVTERFVNGEFVTAGGISTSEINPITMESKICKNLFFAGEVIDIDGFTGGFNLQAAWSTGYIAGKNLSQ